MDTETLEKLEMAIGKITQLSEAAVRSYWRTIASAPKDGQNILGLKDGVMATVRYMPVEKFWTLCVPGTFTLYHDWNPTHWQPLPPLPKNEKGVISNAV